MKLLTYTYSVMPLKYDFNINQIYDLKKNEFAWNATMHELYAWALFFLITGIWCKSVPTRVYKNRLVTMRKCNVFTITRKSCMINFDIVHIKYSFEGWVLTGIISLSLCSIIWNKMGETSSDLGYVPLELARPWSFFE